MGGDRKPHQFSSKLARAALHDRESCRSRQNDKYSDPGYQKLKERQRKKNRQAPGDSDNLRYKTAYFGFNGRIWHYGVFGWDHESEKWMVWEVFDKKKVQSGVTSTPLKEWLEKHPKAEISNGFDGTKQVLNQQEIVDFCKQMEREGYHRYNILTANCEHFVNEARYGDPLSQQAIDTCCFVAKQARRATTITGVAILSFSVAVGCGLAILPPGWVLLGVCSIGFIVCNTLPYLENQSWTQHASKSRSMSQVQRTEDWNLLPIAKEVITNEMSQATFLKCDAKGHAIDSSSELVPVDHGEAPSYEACEVPLQITTGGASGILYMNHEYMLVKIWTGKISYESFDSEEEARKSYGSSYCQCTMLYKLEPENGGWTKKQKWGPLLPYEVSKLNMWLHDCNEAFRHPVVRSDTAETFFPHFD